MPPPEKKQEVVNCGAGKTIHIKERNVPLYFRVSEAINTDLGTGIDL
jgi:hypothetical protein